MSNSPPTEKQLDFSSSHSHMEIGVQHFADFAETCVLTPLEEEGGKYDGQSDGEENDAANGEARRGGVR